MLHTNINIGKWKTYSGHNQDGSGAYLECMNEQGIHLRFIFSSRCHEVYLQWVGYSDKTMTALQKIANWKLLSYHVIAANLGKYDCVDCSFTIANINQLYQSLDIIERESPLGELRNQIMTFLAGNHLVSQAQPSTVSLFQQPLNKDQEIAGLKQAILVQARLLADQEAELKELRGYLGRPAM